MFRALDRGPLTVRQLLKLDATFRVPFGSERYLQSRLLLLTRAGLLRRGAYATTEPSVLYYYTLSAESCRLLHGVKTLLARPSAVGISRQQHTRSLGDFRVHTEVGAFASGFSVSDFYAENALRLEAGGKSFFPDCAFTLLAPGDRSPLRFFVELDTGTEPVTSPRERDSWQRKLAQYETLRDSCGYRFRVLSVLTCGAARLDHIRRLAARVAHDPRRPLFCGICLSDYLAKDNPLTTPCFLDHRGQAVALVPPERQHLTRSATVPLLPVFPREMQTA